MSDSRGKLWGGRFSVDTAQLVRQLNDSLPFDRRLWRHDIAGSIAHATMLGRVGVLSAAEAETIVSGLGSVEAGLSSGAQALDAGAEDIHAAVEDLLRSVIGPLAGKLHTARSRNDQVATDLRLYLRDAIDDIDTRFASLQRAILEIAEREMDTILPGYTHLQHAQPVLLSHHLLAYAWMMQRDRERLLDCRRRTNRLPLGAGALAGTTFPIDASITAELLGFDAVIPNSLDAVSDRDFALEFLSAASIAMVHLSRLAEEMILWNSQEFAFVRLDDSVTTGSSIMPQKKNPDVAELVRGKCGRVIGDLVGLLTVMKGLPLAYNKDMQEDKEPVFDAVTTLALLLPAVEMTLQTAVFDRGRMRELLGGDFSTATDVADLLVRHGMAFRDAHHIVGRMVQHCIGLGIGLEAMSDADLEQFAPGLGAEVREALSVEASVASRRGIGGTAPHAVMEQLSAARQAIAAFGLGSG